LLYLLADSIKLRLKRNGLFHRNVGSTGGVLENAVPWRTLPPRAPSGSMIGGGRFYAR